MDYQKELLLFLYDKRNSLKSVKINHIFVGCDSGGVRDLIKELKNKEIIKIDNNYRMLGCGNNPIGSIDNIELKAKLNNVIGEKYVLDTYMKKNDVHQINANQVVYAVGDISAPISLANDHSLSEISNNAATIKSKQPIIKRVIKFVFWFAGGIVSLFGLYGLIKYFI